MHAHVIALGTAAADAAIAKGHIKADQIQVVWESPPIPESPMVWRKDLSPETKAKVKAAFLTAMEAARDRSRALAG